jgi:hypothetical protein
MVIFIRGALDHRKPGQSYIDAVIDGRQRGAARS